MSVLDDLGEEVTGIIAPVSLCMALTIALVKVINPSGDSNRQTVVFATAYYEEDEEDSTSTKLSGSIVNALLFVGFVTFLTFVLFLLFKYGCVKFIYFYLGFAMLDIFFFLAGAVIIKLLREMDLHMDAISLCFILFNFSVVGTLGLFFWKIPIVVKQGYLIVTGVTVAYIFTWIPEWSTWTLLIFMSVYDICAVLLPGGPLKALVELAMERNEAIPALVYEVRPTQGQQGSWNNRYNRGTQSINLATQYRSGCLSATFANITLTDQPDTTEVVSPERVEERVALIRSNSGQRTPTTSNNPGLNQSEENAQNASTESGERMPNTEEQGGEGMEIMLPDSLKLGLGDFIFYSVLVGRAAFYDFMTVFAAYFGIIAGMCLTLLLLALYHQALPALPISILLGLVFYFLTRLVLEPFIVPLSLALSFF